MNDYSVKETNQGIMWNGMPYRVVYDSKKVTVKYVASMMKEPSPPKWRGWWFTNQKAV